MIVLRANIVLWQHINVLFWTKDQHREVLRQKITLNQYLIVGLATCTNPFLVLMLLCTVSIAEPLWRLMSLGAEGKHWPVLDL